MLTDTKIFNYYSAITRYWTDKYNEASYNLEQEFAQFALDQVEHLKTFDDTPSNIALLSAENTAYESYRNLVSKVKAGIATQAEADTALETFKAAKIARRSSIPKSEWFTETITKQANALQLRVKQQYDRLQDENSELALITATGIVDTVKDFQVRVEQWISQNATAEDAVEYAGTDSITEKKMSLASFGLFSDGNYGTEINRVSPEGYLYGDSTMIQQVPHDYWWNGLDWIEIPEVLDQVDNPSLLPDGKPFGEIWRARRYVSATNTYVWDYYLSTGDNWSLMVRYSDRNNKAELPLTGYHIGDWRRVIERDVPVYWSGEELRRYNISSLAGSNRLDQLEEITSGINTVLQPGFALIYISKQELSLKSIDGDFDYIRVNGQGIEASKRTSVFTHTPVLGWNEEAQSLYYSTLQPNTSYHVYLANRSEGFNINVYDYRGKLFCSSTIPTNNQLGDTGLGQNAIYIGRCQTNSSGDFLYELDVSTVSKAADLKETFRDFSDFDLEYTSQDELTLRRIYGAYGQIYIPESLVFLGEGITVTTSSPRILYDDITGMIVLDTSDIAPSSVYYVYLASNTDIYNFNELNTDTSLPWHPEDNGAGDGITGPYIASNDLRLSMFLSLQEPDEGRLAETYYGFWARHIGQIRTDPTSKFIYSSDISAIRQKTLRPSFFDGLAEIQIVSSEEGDTLSITEKTGTTGAISVNSQTISVAEIVSPSVSTTDTVWQYSESPPFLVDTGYTVGSKVGIGCNLYLTNSDAAWGDKANSLLAIDSVPSANGYLGFSYPRNNARWIAEAEPQASQYGPELVVNGSFITESEWELGFGWSIDTINQEASYTYYPYHDYSVTDDNTVTCDEWNELARGVIVNESTPGTKELSRIFHAVSFDNGATYKIYSSGWVEIVQDNNGTWQYYNGSNWQDALTNSLAAALGEAAAITDNQWEKAAIESLTVDDWTTDGGWTTACVMCWTTHSVAGQNYIADGATNAETTKATPSMTSNTEPSPCGVSYTSRYDSTYDGYRAFDGSSSTGWATVSQSNPYAFPTLANPQSIVFDFGAGNGKCINKYRLRSRSNSTLYFVRTWTLEATNLDLSVSSSQGAGWTILHTVIDAPDQKDGGYLPTTGYYTFQNETEYRKYRLRVTDKSGTTYSYFSISEIELIEADNEPCEAAFNSVTFFYYNITGNANSKPLSQEIQVDDVGIYHIRLDVKNLSSGDLTISMGEAQSDPIYESGSVNVYLIADDIHDLVILPSEDFVGTVSQVSVRTVLLSSLLSESIQAAIVNSNPVINNSTISSGSLWTSEKIAAEISTNDDTDITSFVRLEIQKAIGLPVLVEYTEPTPNYDGSVNSNTEYAHLEMISDTSPSPLFTASSSNYSTTYKAWKAFNKSNMDRYDCWMSGTETYPRLLIDFGESKIINKYAMLSRNYDNIYLPTQWVLEGSDTGKVNDPYPSANWQFLHTSSLSSYKKNTWYPGLNSYYTFYNDTPYRMYRIVVTGKRYGYCAIGELKLIDYIPSSSSATIRISPTGDDARLFFPNRTFLTINQDQLVSLSGETGVLYHIYIKSSGTVFTSTTPPTTRYSGCEFLGESLLIGYCAFASSDMFLGDWNVYSYSNEPKRSYSAAVSGIDTIIQRVGFVVPDKSNTVISRELTRVYLYEVPLNYSKPLLDVSLAISSHPPSSISAGGLVPSGVYDRFLLGYTGTVMNKLDTKPFFLGNLVVERS